MCKAVRFSHAESTAIKTLKPTFKFSQSERNATWYQRSELISFRTNAKLICRSTIRKRKLSSTSNAIDSFNINEINVKDSDACVRGLELHTDVERKKRKHYANKIIVTAQKSMKATELAIISSAMSNWAKENAIKDGRLDFLAACPVYLS